MAKSFHDGDRSACSRPKPRADRPWRRGARNTQNIQRNTIVSIESFCEYLNFIVSLISKTNVLARIITARKRTYKVRKQDVTHLYTYVYRRKKTNCLFILKSVYYIILVYILYYFYFHYLIHEYLTFCRYFVSIII